ncbi:MAG: flagellar basal body P-ring formation protein FlgA [Acidobacteria bacterium]|nr:flagellar basal body P-ring formation protein FlgA [Acidobacteriota bacterium]
MSHHQAAKILLLPVLLAGQALLPARAHAAERVGLRREVQVRTETIRLSDLLPSTAPARMRDLAAQIVLGPAPLPGSRRILRDGFIKHSLHAVPELEEALRIPERISIVRAYRRLSREEILRAIRQALERNGLSDSLALLHNDLELKAPVLVTEQDPGLQVTRIEFDPVRKQTQFRFELLNEPRVRPFTVMAPLRISFPTLVAQRDLSSGELSSESDFRVEDRVRAQDLSRPQVSPEQLAGKLARRSIPAGQAVNPSMFRPQILAERGKPATMLVEGKRFRITMPVIPLQRGVRGQIIRVRSVATRRIFEAEVVAPGLLQKVY